MTDKKPQSPGIRFGLREKLLIIILIIVSLPIAFFSLRAQSILKSELEDQYKSSIKADTQLMVSAIRLWQTRNESEILNITDPLSSLPQAYHRYQNEPTEENRKTIRRILDRSLLNNPVFLELSLNNPENNEILISTNTGMEGEPGHYESFDDWATRTKMSSPIFYSPGLDEYTMIIQSPLKNESGQISAILEARLNLHSLTPIIFNATSTGDRSEVFLVKEDGHAVIRNLTIDPATLRSDMDEPHEASEYTDHKNEAVIGYQEYMPELDVILIHNNALRYLLEPVRELTQRIWIITAVTFLLALLLTLTLVRRFTRPILSLTQTAQKIARGKLSLRSDIDTKDEVGLLSQAFDNMTDSLTSSLNEISVKNALLEAQYNASIYGQISIGKDGKVLSWNQSFKEIWGLPPHILKTRNPEEILKHCAKKVRDKERFIQETRKLFSLKKKKTHDIIEFSDGRTLSRHFAPLLGKKGKLLGRIFTCRDITEETELSRTKNEFITLATHQLQTPLTAIRWMLETLAKNIKGKKEQKDMVTEARQSTERVISLVNDMMNVSRLDAGNIRIAPEKIDVAEFLEEVITPVREAAKKKRIIIELKTPARKVVASLDKGLISEAILNLLSNAIRFSGRSKKITVTLKDMTKNIEIAVKDRGIGISKEEQRSLFTKFFRAKEASRYNTTGSGLGLYVTKKILEACKGDVRVNSQLGKGSVFTITLPLRCPGNTKKSAGTLIRKGFTF